MNRSPLRLIFWVILIVLSSGCASQLMFVPREISSEEFQQKIDRLQPDDVVDITDLNKKNYSVKISDKGPTFLEGYASYPGIPGPEWWPSRHEFARMKWLDDVVVPSDFVYDPEMEIADAGKADVTVLNAARPIALAPETATPAPAVDSDPAYATVTASLQKGEMIDVIPLSGNRFRIELTEVGPDYLKGVRFEDSGIGGQAPPQRYEIREFRSINGAAVPYDLGQFKVGDRVEFKTLSGEIRRIKITEISRDDVTGFPLPDDSGQGPMDPVYLRREEIASGKIYLTGGEKAERVGKVIAAGAKTIAIIVLSIGVLFVLLMFELAASPGLQY